jgi:biopolymer transport protein ExbD
MTRSLRCGIGLALILVGSALYLLEQAWLDSRNFWPVRLPVLVGEKTRTAPFEINLPDGYNIDVWVDSSAVWSLSDDEHPARGNNCAYRANSNLTKKWRLFKNAKLLESGETAGSHLGNFSGKGTYEVEVEFPAASQCWQHGNPRLMVYTWATYTSFDQIVATCSVVIVCSGIIWLLVPLISSTLKSFGAGNDAKLAQRFEPQNVDPRRRSPNRIKLTLVSHFPLIAIGAMLPLLILGMIVRPPESTGFYVSISQTDVDRAWENRLVRPVVVMITLLRPNDYVNAEFRVQGKKVAAEELSEALKRELAMRAEWVVFIEGNNDIPWQAVMTVADVARSLRAKPVLVTEKMKLKR